jgi:uncharacterized membrane protein
MDALKVLVGSLAVVVCVVGVVVAVYFVLFAYALGGGLFTGLALAGPVLAVMLVATVCAVVCFTPSRRNQKVSARAYLKQISRDAKKLDDC